ncbi:hypothetical protein EVAR_46674_1 [Eumeta japonica]|uniref:Uncharacterized protein n=1 Tax=Eumeta variegata TaxID=151549 RepID=A0A4C1Y6J3_EUMVA|nr:hypothetical protein EVAR_46674_1 [Eumeta japonica]
MSATCARNTDSRLYRNDRRGFGPLIGPRLRHGTIPYATHMCNTEYTIASVQIRDRLQLHDTDNCRPRLTLCNVELRAAVVN